MNEYISGLNLVDLISEKHKVLRDKVNEMSGEPLNKTETHILAMLELHGTLSISEVSRLIGISRQGTQKTINNLLAEGYVDTAAKEGNSRDKPILLTLKGAEACRSMLEIKQTIEAEITARIGKEQVEILRKLLTQVWL
ncbi:winged helix-turn-helix transcriptional regulator [Paenibacillus tritici]|uniref:MarR family winged helix-turn-helix transcriptional regulator n=1 Tax=Paenibacillus tritici TaxID=1873425 RepID=UPI001BA8B2D6|nr:MarR family winged helix-turn-helix transcriptional regulator [Paenibacillus tritici]QUL54130.1 winged helix-turn-helix transcriptional regulator [Paenibacillus tritici]